MSIQLRMNISAIRRSMPALLRNLRAAASKRELEWESDTRGPPLCISPVARGSQVLYMTKSASIFGATMDDERLVGRTTIISRYGPISRPVAERVWAEALDRRLPVRFVGDLDPHDLTVFLTLACAQPRGCSLVHYIGIDHSWVSLCCQYATDGVRARPCGLPVLKMDSHEREHLRWLMDVPLDWSSVVGPMGVELLQSGYKLELEGATGAAFYRPAFYKKLATHVFQANS